MRQTVHDARNRTGKSRPGVGNAVAHRVARTDLDRNAVFLGQMLERFRKRYNKTVEVRTGNVLEMAAGRDAHVQHFLDNAEIFVHRGAAGQTHFVVDMVVGAAHENAGFADAEGLDKFKVLRCRADPRGDLGEFVAERLTFAERFAVLFGIYKEFRLTDQPVRAAETVHHPVQIHNLLCGERLHRLLTVAEGRVGDPDVFGHLHRYETVVEGDLRHGLIVVQTAVEVRGRAFLQGIAVRGLFDEVGLAGILDLRVVFTDFGIQGGCIYKVFIVLHNSETLPSKIRGIWD